MEFDITSAIPVKENAKGAEELSFGFDMASAKPVSQREEAIFSALDSANIWMDTAKALVRGVERIPAGFGSGLEFLGRDIIAETKAETMPLVPFPGVKSIPWLRVPKGKPSKVGEAIDNFFVKFGTSIADIGKNAKDFYSYAASKGIESPNPAVLMGWKHPFRKSISMAAENFPLLGVAAGVTAATGQPTLGAATFFPVIAGDMYEDAINNGVDPLRATDIAVLDGAVQTALETIVLGNWMKGGNILKRVFRTSLQEGLIEEGTQQLFENSLKVLNWQDSRPIWDRMTDGLAEGIVAGGISGGALGVFQAPTLEEIRYDIHQEVIKEGNKQGVSEEDISKTLDKIDEVIDKTVGIEPVTTEGKALPKEVTALSTDDLEVLIDQRYEAGATQEELDLLENEYAKRVVEDELSMTEEEISIAESTHQGADLEEQLSSMYSRYINPELRSGMEEKDILDNMRSAVETYGGKGTDEQILAAAKDIYEHKQQLINKYKSPQTKKAKILKKVISVLPEDVEKIKGMAEEISAGEAGKRMPTETGTWIGIASTFPQYFQNKGYTKKEAIAIINKVLEGKPITEKQQKIFDDLLTGYKEQLSQEIKSYEQGKQEEELKSELTKQGYSESETKEIIQLAQEDAQGEIDTEGVGRITGSKFFKTVAEADDYIDKAESLGGKAKIVRASEEGIEVIYNLPDTLTPSLEIRQQLRAPEKKDLFQEEGELFKKKAPLSEEEVISAIEEAGGTLVGISELKDTLYRDADFNPIEPTVYFNDPAGSTHTLPLSKITPENIKAKFIKPTAAYSIAPGEEMPEQVVAGRGKRMTTIKKIPPVTATGKMAWEETKAWIVNLGRDIAGVFEREIGPELQVSKRLKRFLGVYYPTLGPSGTIRVKTLADEMTLFHEAGHFLDDSLSGMTGWNVGQRGTVRDELLVVTHYVSPFEERYVPTGKVSKKTGKPLMKQDSYTAYRRQSRELFAEYLALYVSDPAKAQQLAPTFTSIVEQEIAKDQEFAYIVTKLREFEALMKPIKEYVNALRKIPEFKKDIVDWAEKGNILQQIWRNQVGDKVWNLYSKAIENLGKKLHLTSFFEKGGLNDAVFEILRQRRKLIQGQQAKLKEELVEPISKLGKEDQQFIAESLQRFDLLEPENPISKLTEEARKELALWGNEARKLGLLNDEIFWNNVGQYFPFFYETKEFEKNKRNFGYFPSKAIRANFAALKHKMTDEEFGRKVLEAQYGTWPSSQKKIAGFSKEELQAIGQNAREELGLMKTAAYPLQRRLFGMIEMVYTVKAFNTIGMLPGIIGTKGMEGYDKMPSGKKYGILAEQYVPVDLVKEVSKWNLMQSELGNFWRAANSVWKLFKVPYNPAAVSRNIITNAIMTWFGDVPIYNPVVAVKGVKSFVARDEVYKILRDRGLYHNTYSAVELKALAFQVDQDPDNPFKQIQIWANNLAKVINSPAYLYGAIEDASKTIIARYVLDQGGTPEQAVKFADKLLFDYSQVSEAVGYARQSFYPFITWSAKVLPRMFEFAIRKPEKFALVIASVAIFNAISRSMLGIDKDDEERLKPDYIRGKTTLLLPGRDLNGDLNWIDLSYFLPWGNWLPIDKGNLAVPQTLTMGGVLPVLYNAFVLNYDPFTDRKIAEDYLSDDEKIVEQVKYILKNLSPQLMTTMLSGKLYTAKPDRYGRKKELSKILSGEFLGVRFTQDISAYRKNVQEGLKRDFYEGRSAIKKKLKAGELTDAQAKEKIQKLKERFKKKKETH